MSRQIDETGLCAVYYDALQAYEAGMREYTAIMRNAAVPAGATVVATAPVIVAVPPIIGSGAMSGPPPPLASVSAVVTYDPNAPRSPGMTPMAPTPPVSNAPQMRRFTAMGKELPANEFPTDFDASWLMLP
jgi:hypothetical protein